MSEQNIVNVSGFDITSIIQSCSKADLTALIDAIQASENYAEKVTAQAVISRDIDRAKIAIGQSLLDFDTVLEKWLKVCSRTDSDETRRSYKRIVTDFNTFMVSNSVASNNALFATRTDANNYLLYLKNKGKSAKSIVKAMRALSSFFYHLLTSMPNDFAYNPFIKMQLPRLCNVKPLDVPCDSDLLLTKQAIMKNFESKSTKHSCKKNGILYCLIIDLIDRYGFREAAFENMFIYRDRKFKCLTKGKWFQGQFKQADFDLILAYEGIKKSSIHACGVQVFTCYKARNFRELLKRINKRLYESDSITCLYSPHDIRHKFSIADYTKHKSMEGLRRKLGHESIATTQGYLRGFDIDC
jgi:site-specific recombinase XerC